MDNGQIISLLERLFKVILYAAQACTEGQATKQLAHVTDDVGVLGRIHGQRYRMIRFNFQRVINGPGYLEQVIVHQRFHR